MARHARHIRGHELARERARMAAVARGVGMRAGEREACGLVAFELRERAPGDLVMAARAVVADLAEVRVFVAAGAAAGLEGLHPRASPVPGETQPTRTATDTSANAASPREMQRGNRMSEAPLRVEASMEGDVVVPQVRASVRGQPAAVSASSDRRVIIQLIVASSSARESADPAASAASVLASRAK